MKKVEVVAHDPNWRGEFETEAGRIADAMGDVLVAIHHIGSTAIAGIYAKPVIDILVEVRDVSEVDESSSEMTRLGYEALGEFGIAGRRYFRKDDRKASGLIKSICSSRDRNKSGGIWHFATL